ncbi:MAG TPA: PEP-utilizing enzyme [Trueperaceae bacterium]|nr:PEP-utilizing enzyme [Trueperaceae bacterium]
MSDHSVAGEPLPLPVGVPVPWLEQDDADHLWERDRVHAPHQMAVLDYDFWQHFIDNGIDYAARLYSLSYRYRSRRFWTRYYSSEAYDSGNGAGAPNLVLDTVANELGERWTESWLPEIQLFSSYLFDLELTTATDEELVAHLDGARRRLRRAWEVHFESTVASGRVWDRYVTLFTELFEGATTHDAVKLLVGFPNMTTAAGHALWSLRDIAAGIPAVVAAFDLADEDVLTALEAAPEAVPFLGAFNAYLHDYCRRPPFVTICQQTIDEQPLGVIAQLRDALRHPERDPEQHRVALALERDEAIADARAALVYYPTPVRDEFERVLALAQSAMRYKEDHSFYIDFQLTAAARRVPVEIGKRLAATGLLESADDIIHLTFDELRGTLTSQPRPDRRALVAERRAEMLRFAPFEPPVEIGTRPPPKTGSDAAPAGAAPDVEAGVLHGTPVSAGTGRGRARVAALLDDARELRPGEVLVAPSTAQPWTPLFATAAALVTETGGVLSHAAIVAREYRLPAVAGVKNALTTLHTGMLLEVDGSAGTVRIIDES